MDGDRKPIGHGLVVSYITGDRTIETCAFDPVLKEKGGGWSGPACMLAVRNELATVLTL